MDHQRPSSSASPPQRAPPTISCTVFPVEVTFFPATADERTPSTSLLFHKHSRTLAQSHSSPALSQQPPLAPTQQLSQRRPVTAANNRRVEEDGPIINRTMPTNCIVIPPEQYAVQRRNMQPQQQKRHSAQSDKGGAQQQEEGLALALQQKIFEHYHTVAYALVIMMYLLTFCEYLYLRLLSLIFPEPIIYRRHCDKRRDFPIYRNELHFASGMAVFLAMSCYQLVCFFLLTVSTKYMEMKRTYSHVISIEQRLHQELVFTVKRTMFVTLYPTFGIYLLCSTVVLCAIFYMVGLRDPIVHVGSQVIVYAFDLCVVLYFLAFPVLCVLFHPEIDCRAKLRRMCCAGTSTGEVAGHSINSKSLQTTDQPRRRDTTSGVDGTSARQARGAGTVHSAPGDAVTPNYGSIIGGEHTHSEEAKTNSRESGTQTTDSVRRMVTAGRERIRQDRYQRLRGGSDESAKCADTTPIDGIVAKIERNQRAMKDEPTPGSVREEEDENEVDEEEKERRTDRETQLRGLTLALDGEMLDAMGSDRSSVAC